jgi:single-stranded-DNA-specific exonuclease
MDSRQFEKFMAALQDSARRLKDFPAHRAAIVHHNDTDGIAAGAILKKSLEREGVDTENIPIERVHPSFLPRIHTAERKIIFYADLGSQAASWINDHRLAGTAVFILDHHPPFQSSFRNLNQVNPESFGIDGDLQASAASVAFFWARALHEKNEDLAYLGVIGAIGDHQLTDQKVTGINERALQSALGKGAVHLSPEGPDGYRFTLFHDRTGMEVSREITDLAVNGYYQGGAGMALKFCLEGPGEEFTQFGLKMRRIQEDRFREQMEKIQFRKISREGEIQWVDVRGSFHPLGLKSIGIFCEEVIRAKIAEENRYVAGFMDFPEAFPILGAFAGRDTKVSLRIPPDLKKKIEKGEKPDLTEIVPEAAERVGGFAEGCHRFAAACIIPQDKKRAFVEALNDLLHEFQLAGQKGRGPFSSG